MSEKKAIKLPEKRISIKKIRNHRYVYYIDSYYVTDNGSRTHRDVSIGKLNEEDPTTFFPNKTYWQYFPNTQTTETEIETIQHAGFSQLVKMLASQLGLDTLLNQHFGHQMDDILAIATFMLAQGNTMMYLDDYYETHYNPYSATPAQRKLEPIYEAITKPKRWAFFKDWQSQIVTEGDYIAYDVSSISTYGKSIDLAAMGYNRDHENQLEFNRFKTHHQTSTDGKFFVGFIAQIILAHTKNQLSTCKNPPVPTFESLVLEMDKLQRIIRYDGRIRLTTLTRKQKGILELFNIDTNDFTNDLVKKS